MSDKSEETVKTSEDDFVKKLVMKGFSMQETALEKSTKQYYKDQKEYEEVLKKYEEVTSLLMEKEYRHKNLVAAIEAKNRVKALYDEQLLETEIKAVQEEILDVCEKEMQESNEFTASVNTIIAEFGNLDPAFERELLVERINECKTNIESIRAKVDNLESLSEKDNNLFVDKFDSTLFRNLTSEVKNQKTKIDKFTSENKEATQLIQKNIGFLRQKIAENKLLMDQL